MKLEFLFHTVLPQGRTVPKHRHQALELVYYNEGDGRTLAGGQEFVTRARMFAITPAGVFHDQSCSQTIKAICLGLSGSPLDHLTGCWRDSDGLLRQACQRLLQESSLKRPGFELICDGLTAEIAGLVLRAVDDKRPRDRQQALVQKALDIIQGADGKISVRDLARRLFISPDHLRHLFAKTGHPSPLRCIIERRLERARNLLAQPELSVTEVAEEAGFADVYHFSRLFKQRERRTATAYRRQITEIDKI